MTQGHVIVIICHVQLSMKNTPIHEWRVPGVPAEFQLFVKREDLTGSTLSGNKVHCVYCASCSFDCLYNANAKMHFLQILSPIP